MALVETRRHAEQNILNKKEKDDGSKYQAFNTIFFPTLVTGEVAGQPLDVLIAGDDDAAKATVSQLIADGGMRPIDAGPLAYARYLEALGFLGIKLPFSRSAQFQSAWKLLA